MSAGPSQPQDSEGPDHHARPPAGGKSASAGKKKRRGKNFPPDEAVLLRQKLKALDEHQRKNLVEEYRGGKTCPSWDGLKELDRLIENTDWLQCDEQGRVVNVEIQLKNAYGERQKGTFGVALETAKATWKTAEGCKVEAKKLVALATASLTFENLNAAVLWEGSRLLFAMGALPDFWQQVARGQRPDSSIPINDADLFVGSECFPLWSWLEVPKQNELLRWCIGNQSTGARVLDAREGWWYARRFTEWGEGQKLDLFREVSDKPPSHYPLDDGGMVVMLRLYPHCGWNLIANSLKQELKRLGLDQYGRSGHGKSGKLETLLKGLAALWMEAGKIKEPEQNQMIFRNRADKGDTKLLKEASGRAKDFLGELKATLEARCKPWAESQELAKRRDAGRERRLGKAIRQHAMRARRNPVPRLPQ